MHSKAHLLYETGCAISCVVNFTEGSALCVSKLVFQGSSHRPVFYLKHTAFRRLDAVSVTGAEIGTSSIVWTQLRRFHLTTETESSLRVSVRFK
jgi:hypothetical protein